MRAHCLKPNFGVNYDVGYIGFTVHSDDPVGAGIAWFERWPVTPAHIVGVPNGICVTHALVVSGADECIEAHARVGVQRSTLSKYFNDPHCQIFFRKPRGWDLTRGQQIVSAAAHHIGDDYGYGVIIADLLANTFLGHWVNRCTCNVPNRFVCRLLNRAGAEVCSQLCAMALQEQSWTHRVGQLALPPAMVTPQALFEDDLTFEPWKDVCPPHQRTWPNPDLK